MEKKTMGSFMAALRKANGLTQQEVADRLNVSNKAVSRWERDECAPDISLIPAIAELYGVTCDELLKGERICRREPSERMEGKAEKQLKALAVRALSRFKVQILISLAITAVGLTCMFGIAYGFFRPVIGFAVMLILDVVSVLLAVIAVVKLKQLKAEHELMENAGAALLERLDYEMGIYSFAAFFAVIASVVLSLPLVCLRTEQVKSVLYIGSYFAAYFIPLAVILICLFLLIKQPYINLITDAGPDLTDRKTDKRVMRLHLVQLGTALAGLVLLLVSERIPPDWGLLVMLCGVVYFIIEAIRHKDIRRDIIISGIRNLLLTADILFIYNCRVVFYMTEYDGSTQIIVEWDKYTVFLAMAAALVIFTVFRRIEEHFRKVRKSD